MGDTDVAAVEDPAENSSCEVSKPSIEILKEAKSAENIAIAEPVQENTENVEKLSLKNRSDIFSLNENKNLSSTIFSIRGAPSKTINKTASNTSNETVKTEGSTSSKQFRNPVTGIGVSSKDEFRNKPSKRKDGNPLLGVGYKDDDAFFNAPSTQRIPPGGHSKGLW